LTFEFKERRQNVPSEELLDDLIAVSKKSGKSGVTMEEYAAVGNFHPSTLVRRFGSWTNTLDKAGLKQNRTPMNVPEEVLFENLSKVWSSLGRQPTYNSLTNEVSDYSSGTYEKRFGTWNKALKAFVSYVQSDFDNDQKLKVPQSPSPMSRKSGRRTTRNINWRLRAKILIRDNCICQMCGASPAKDPDVDLHVDHITAWANGGETIEENLQTLCSKCNIGKSDMDISNLDQ
jgi:5-methylcytosine-specific restriction endonuclease McrA